MRRAEILAKESNDQKEAMSKMTAAKSPPTPKASAPPSKPQSPASVLSIPSTEDEEDPDRKKRTLEASKLWMRLKRLRSNMAGFTMNSSSSIDGALQGSLESVPGSPVPHACEETPAADVPDRKSVV